MEWEVWLDKGEKTNRAKKIIRDAVTIPDVMPIEIKHVDGTYERPPPVNNDDIETHHAVKDKPKPDKTIPRTIREFDDETHEDPFVNNSTSSVDSWESWLEKVDEPPTKITIFDIKEDDSFEEKQRKLHQLSNYNDSQDMNEGVTTVGGNIDQQRVHKLLKNNATETSHKDEKEKVEWDGKFSSSTIEDEVKDEDEKSNSEEESLEELTDGKLVEVEKLKSWEAFLVKINQYDKGTGRKRTVDGDGVTLDTDLGITTEPLTESGKVRNPKGSIDPNKKTVRRLNHETGLRESVFIKGKPSTNPETPTVGGGRPDSGEQGSRNDTAGGTGEVTEQNTNSILYNVLSEEAKKKEIDNKTDDPVVISNDESEPATEAVEETPEEKRRREIKGTYRKERNADGSIKKSWESWLEKGRWDNKPQPKTSVFDAVETDLEEDKGRTTRIEEDEIDSGVYQPSRLTAEPEFGAKDIKSLNIHNAHLGKSWNEWLDKMQGAGDARFGNQHLTGLDQKPVNNEEDEANILPEKDEKTDDKEEKEEITDNKPYKALGEE